jgi:hypothetical protein
MSHIRTLLVAGAFCAAIAGSASAQTSGTADRVSLAALITSRSIGRNMQAAASPVQNMSVRGGVMFSPRGAGVAGVDFDLPSVSLGNGWRGRVDADVIFKANLGGINTAIPVTFNQIYISPNAAGDRNIYYGAGVGAILGGSAVFDGKLILGTDVTQKVSAELNAHFTENDTLLMILARFHL